MTLGLALVVTAVLAPAVARVAGRTWALRVGLAVVAVGLVLDVSPRLELAGAVDLAARLDVLGFVGSDPSERLVLLGALLWCGPMADLVVRRVLEATRLPAPEAAAEAGLRAGRWIGRLERWLLVVCVAAGEPALAVIPIGGKALFRYAEVVAEARVGQARIETPDDVEAPVTRSTLIDYVIVGSLASWVQAIVLALIAAG